MRRTSQVRLPANVTVHLYPNPADMRKSFDGLHALVRDRFHLDPLSGHLYLFANRTKNRVKILYWDSSGLVVLAKRSKDGFFAIPFGDSTRLEFTADELKSLLDGVDIHHPGRRKLRRQAA